MLHDSVAYRSFQRLSLVDLFRGFAGLPSEFVQYDDGYRSWRFTYSEVSAAARHLASRLRAQNIGKGDKVIFWSENRPEWIAAFWGCVLEGVIAVPIDYRSSATLVVRKKKTRRYAASFTRRYS